MTNLVPISHVNASNNSQCIAEISVEFGIFEYVCNMIKRNESDVGHIVFEILAKTVFKFLCFILFLALVNPS